MEKLQKALKKAREQRGGPDDPALLTQRPDAGAAPSDVQEASHPPEGDVDALWQALSSFEPQNKVMETHRIVTSTAGRMSTSFDILRTKILLTMRRNSWTRLAITSPTMGCGKTTLACNLAIGFARSPDQRTVLMEYDLRRPSIAKILGLPGTIDVTEMLTGKVSFAEQALCYRGNVAIAAARNVDSDPTSVLTSKIVHDALSEIEARYTPDVMIFDLPPLLVGDDTRSVLKDMDCAVLVARSGVTTVSQIDNCEREIAEHTNMLGMVLNQCRDVDNDDGYYE